MTNLTFGSSPHQQLTVNMLHIRITQTAGRHISGIQCWQRPQKAHSNKAHSMLATAKGVRLSNGSNLEVIRIKANKVRAS
jgi:hypothetical protein